MPPKPACQHFLPDLSAFIDGELPPSQRVEVERHVAACPDCAARVADLRAESGLVRIGLEMAADQVDWSGFSQKVLAQLTPHRTPLWERWKLSLSEMLLYQRSALLTGVAVAAALLMASTLLLRLRVPVGYAPDTMAVQTVKTAPGAKVAPVVLESDQGNAIIWLLDKPVEEQEPGEVQPGGDLDQKPAEGGNL